MNPSDITIQRVKDGEVFSNLSGVFCRVFPLAVNMVIRGDDDTMTVTYYGDLFRIKRRETE